MYDHVQNLSLSFFDEMEVGRIISRLTSDVQVVQDLLTTGSLIVTLQLRRRGHHRRRPDDHGLAARARHLRDHPAAAADHGAAGHALRASPSCRRASASARSTATWRRASPASAPFNRCRARARTAALRPSQRREPQHQQLRRLPQLRRHAGHRDLRGAGHGRRADGRRHTRDQRRHRRRCHPVRRADRLRRLRHALLRPHPRAGHAVHDVPARDGRRRAHLRGARHQGAHRRQGRRYRARGRSRAASTSTTSTSTTSKASRCYRTSTCT